MVNVKSRTDVITNSSSEVYTYITGDAIENVKKMINSFLIFTGYQGKCDDLIEVKGTSSWSRQDILERYLDYEEDPSPEPTDEELEAFVKKEHERALDCWEYPLLMDRLEFIPKVPEAKDLCEKLGYLNNLFTSGDFMC